MQNIGSATFTQDEGGVRLKLQVTKLQPGEHGLHIHQTGVCEAPDFKSAGEHFTPHGKKHGFDNPDGPHLGDLRNLTVQADGTAEVERTIDGATLDDGKTSLLGRAIVIHAQADDYKTEPAGNAGDRVACGVIEKNVREITRRRSVE